MVRSLAPSPASWMRALVLALLVVPVFASAQIIDEEEVNRFSLGGYVGWAGANLGRFNENIDVVNHFLTHQGIPLREADGLSGGASGRGELRYKISDRWMVGFGVASTEAMSRFTVTLGAVDFYARSTQFIPAVYYVFPFVQTSEKFSAVADRMNMYVGAAPIFFSSGKAHMRITDNSNEPVFNVYGDLGELDGEGDATGTGIGIQGLFGTSYQLTRAFSVAGEVGYRFGTISDLNIDRAVGYDRDDTDDDENQREPGDKAITDFFQRPDERNGIPTEDIVGNHIPYYSDHAPDPLNLDFGGFLIHIGLRIHLF